MEVTVQIDVDPLVKRFEEIAEKIETTKQGPFPQEFLNWQGEDLNRRHPVIDEQTDIRLMSKFYDHRMRTVRRLKKGSRKIIRGSRGGFRRPILRPILIMQLNERMMKMLADNITWR